MGAFERPDLPLYHAVTAPAKAIRACQGPCGVLRFSFHLYNDATDVDKVLALTRAWLAAEGS